MLDAQQTRPICGDPYAQRFMVGQGQAMLELCRLHWRGSRTNVTRARVIDDKIRERLAREPRLSVVLIGAGFDSRAFRLSGGRWFELDEPALIEYKELRLPTAECPNPLQRVEIDCSSGSLEATVARLECEAPVLLVMEGVTMYLKERQLRDTLRALRRAVPVHTLLCDLLQRRFLRYTSKVRAAFEAMGATWQLDAARPAEIVISEGYRSVDVIPLVARGVELGAYWVPRFLMRTLLRDIAYGYCVHEFESVPP